MDIDDYVPMRELGLWITTGVHCAPQGPCHNHEQGEAGPCLSDTAVLVARIDDVCSVNTETDIDAQSRGIEVPVCDKSLRI